MRILFDGRIFTARATGITTYAIDAIRAIWKYLDWEIVIASPSAIHKSIEGLPEDKRIRYVVAPIPWWKNAKYKIWYNFYYPHLAKKYKVDMIWSPTPTLPFIYPKHIKAMVTVHDVVDIEFKSTEKKKTIGKFFESTKRDICRADYLWCNSHYTEDKVNQYYPLRKQKGIVVGDGCNTRYRKIVIPDAKRESIYKAFNIDKGFYLFVGTLEPRKNLKFLLQLVPEIYKKTGCKLLVVGGRGWKNSDIRSVVESNPIYEKAVTFCGYLSNEELVELYNTSLCYVSTALNEGFGMPQLEAMNCGCPVISPHNSAMIEVVQGRGVTIEGWDRQNWIDHIVRMLTDDEYRSKFKNSDTSEYNWENIITRVNFYIKERS